ncbi:hypothetical protein AMTRI_Chr03g54100 [Amborella trichopoda]
MSSASTNNGGYPHRLRCRIPCNLSTSSFLSNPRGMYYRGPNCTFFQWCDEYMKVINYILNLRHPHVQQRNQSQVSQVHLMDKQVHLMDKPRPMVIQQRIVDALWRIR